MKTVQVFRSPLEQAERALADQIEQARAIQQAMVPAASMCGDQVEVSCKYRPAAEVGGDFLDYFWVSDRQLGLYLGDVVGKGLPAALYGALAIGILRAIKKEGVPPDSVLDLLNRRLLDRAVSGRYCVVQYAVMDPISGALWFANAGLHPLPIHLSDGNCRELGEGGFPCGLFQGSRYQEHTVHLAPGEAVLFATDGLIEARNQEGQEFGRERLIELCRQHSKQPAGILLDLLFAAVDGFTAGAPIHDDMTAAVLRFTGPNSA